MRDPLSLVLRRRFELAGSLEIQGAELLLLDDPQQRPIRNLQAAHVGAAPAQVREADVLRAQSTRRSTTSTILLTAGSGAA